MKRMSLTMIKNDSVRNCFRGMISTGKSLNGGKIFRENKKAAKNENENTMINFYCLDLISNKLNSIN